MRSHAVVLAASALLVSQATRPSRPVATTASPVASPVASPSASPAACADSSFHRLDFWLGDWDAYDARSGRKYASQTVRAELDGCALVARWTGPEGDRGIGLFAYDPIDRAWTQTYVTNQVPSQAHASSRRGDTTWTGPGVRLRSSSGATLIRLTVTPLAGDRARQLFESSPDGGRTWTVMFDAEHRRAAR